MELGLKGRSALVAGSTGDLGFAVATTLAEEGAKVTITGRDPQRLAQRARMLRDTSGVEPLAVVADLAEPEDVQRLLAAVRSERGGLDIVVANSGGPPRPLADFSDTDPATWTDAFTTQLLAVAGLIRGAIPLLRESAAGNLVAITSATVKEPMPHHVQSTVYRLAVMALCKRLSRELGPAGIRVNTVGPASIETERLRTVVDLTKRVRQVPIGRLGTPADLGSVVAFLVSSRASFVNGANIQVDGGYVAGVL